MTAVENLRRLEIVFPLPDEKTRGANIMNIRPTEADSDLYDITIAIANLINDPLASISPGITKGNGDGHLKQRNALQEKRQC